MRGDNSENQAAEDGPGCSSVAEEQVGVSAKDLPKYAERPAWQPEKRRRGVRDWMRCMQCELWFAADSHKRKFCSNQCYVLHAIASGKFKGTNNPRWKGGVSNDNMRYKRRQQEKYPERVEVRRQTARAVRSGVLVRQPCEKCSTEKTHAHHDDYTKPLDVRWLCRPCHTAHHTAERRAARPADYVPPWLVRQRAAQRKKAG